MRLGERAILDEVSRLCARDRALAAAARGDHVEAPSDKAVALADAARVLREAGVDYALIGGLAVAIHTALPRATLDIDLAVDSRTALEPLLGAFERAGFEIGGRFAHTVNLRHQGGEPVQLAFDPAFDEPIARALQFDVGTEAVRVVGREDLIALKERAASDPKRRKSKALRDRADVELLRGDVPDPEEGW